MPYRNFNKNKDKFPWLGQVVVNGKQKRKQFASKQAAIKWEVEEKAVLLAQNHQKTLTVSLLDWATAYLDYAKTRFSEKTYEEKRMAFRLFFQSQGKLSALSVSEFHSSDAASHLQNQSVARTGNAANKQRKNLRAAWEWGVKFLQLPRENPFAIIQRFAESRNERSVPSIEDFWQVYSLAENYQDRLMLLCCLHTGARRDEVFRLQWKDVDFSARKIRLYTKKNELGEWKSAWIPLTYDLEKMLREHQKTTGLLRFVFLNQCDDDPQKWVPYQFRQHWLKKLCVKAGVKQFGFHGIRHLFASILASKNIPLVEIQKMLRHGSITTTARYIHSLDAGNREAVEVLPGLQDQRQQNQNAVLMGK